MRRTLGTALLSAALLAAGCGGGGDGSGGPGGGGGGGGNTFTATIDGDAWSANAGTITVSGPTPATRQGTLIIAGVETSSGIVLTLMLSFIIGPATQPFGVNIGTNPGGVGSVVVGAESWTTPLDGASGFVIITARTGTRIAGAFHFDAEAAVGTTPAATFVTDGAFDITVPAGLPPLPTGVGSTTIASLGGTPWNAATIVATHPGAGVFGFSASTTTYSLSLVPKVPISAGNSYGIPSQMGMSVIRTGTTDSWYGGVGADVGTVTVSAFTADRLVATFIATLPPLNASSSLAVTGGALNAYLEQ